MGRCKGDWEGVTGVRNWTVLRGDVNVIRKVYLLMERCGSYGEV